jgi:hypothetical protein
MTAPADRVSAQCDQRLARIQLQMARSNKVAVQERARRKAARLVSTLGIVASALALYDLMLLARAHT